jgi:hypothetical protein
MVAAKLEYSVSIPSRKISAENALILATFGLLGLAELLHIVDERLAHNPRPGHHTFFVSRGMLGADLG